MPDNVAVFVDGENISADHAPAIRGIAEDLGAPNFLRVYGDSTKLPMWHKVPGFRLIDAGTGKNATDILLVVDAMDRAKSGASGTIIIASSDRDFTHLAIHLRESGLKVVGVGGPLTTMKFRSACTVFHQLKPTKLAATQPTPVVQIVSNESLDQKIARLISTLAQGDAGIEITRLNAALRHEAAFKITSVAKTWSAYFSARPQIYELLGKGADVKVRLISQGKKRQA